MARGQKVHPRGLASFAPTILSSLSLSDRRKHFYRRKPGSPPTKDAKEMFLRDNGQRPRKRDQKEAGWSESFARGYSGRLYRCTSSSPKLSARLATREAGIIHPTRRKPVSPWLGRSDFECRLLLFMQVVARGIALFQLVSVVKLSDLSS